MKEIKNINKLNMLKKLDEKRAVMGSIVNIPGQQSTGDPVEMARVLTDDERRKRIGKINKKHLKWMILGWASVGLDKDDLDSLLDNVITLKLDTSVSEDGFLIQQVTKIFSGLNEYQQALQIAETRAGGLRDRVGGFFKRGQQL